MQKTNTAYNSLQSHLLKLEELGFISVQSGTSKYAITQRGKDFHQKWMELQELLMPKEQVVLTKTKMLIEGKRARITIF
jgi:predicted transcriptional regulator